MSNPQKSKLFGIGATYLQNCRPRRTNTIVSSVEGNKKPTSRGPWQHSTEVRWLSHPAATARAELKLLQLSIAHDIGFITPVTATTNDPGTVSEMSQDHELVAKAVRSGYVNSPQGFRAMFTTQLSEEDLAELDGLALAPATFQEMVPKKSDIRVTVVGPKVFAAEILSQERESSKTDWRATDDPFLKHRRHCLPNDIAQKCRRLTSELGIDFGAIDLALTNEDSYIFIEWEDCNIPQSQETPLQIPDTTFANKPFNLRMPARINPPTTVPAAAIRILFCIRLAKM